MLYYLQTIPGLGPLAWQEVQQRLSTSDTEGLSDSSSIRFVPGRNDIVLLRYAGNPRALLNLRVSEDVFAVTVRAFHVVSDERGLRQMYAATRETRAVGDALTAWKKALNTRRVPSTFRMVVRAVGSHRFTRRQIGQAVADAIKAGWPGRWRQVDEDADVEIWATLLEHELLCGLRLSSVDMRQRGMKTHLPAALRPALAAAMVMLTEPEPDDVFLDPLAGTGTLLVERAAAGPFRELYGSDINTDAVRAMLVNTRKIHGQVTCERWDARHLPLPDASVDKIAMNMPFGKQVAPDADLPVLYREILAEVQRVLRPGGRLVVLVGDARMLNAARTAAARQLRPGQRQRVEVLGMGVTICIFDR